MDNIHHEVWINADRSTVFDAITSKEGLDAWWGTVVNAEARPGFVVEFDHGLGDLLRMRITDLAPDERLVWECLSDFKGPNHPGSEWLGTTLSFELRDGGHIGFDKVDSMMQEKFTILDFKHTGWPGGARWIGFCNNAWGQCFTGLTKYCEEQGSARS
jgi:uncharacterized protein YndB with AHSA1/START domain